MITQLKFIANHPFNSTDRLGALVRFVKWQINTKFNPYPIVYPFTEHSKFLVWKGLHGATGNMYCGLQEEQDMGFLLHFLRKEDIFMDVGANIGSYTLLASAEIGAKTISIEPIPTTFEYLKNNVFLNQINAKVTLLNIGLGSEKGSVKFTQGLDTANHVATTKEKDVVEVTVDTLDNIAQNQCPILIKIDVEGFETEVLKGATNTLKQPELKAIIIELNGSGNRYGYDENKIHQTFLNAGFAPFDYNPFKRQLTELTSFGVHNTIYLKDPNFVRERIKNARKIKVNSREI